MTGTDEPLLYTSCFELPLYNFIQISLYGIQEKWRVTPEAWEEICSQYSELSGDKNMTHMFNLQRQITYLTNKLNIIQFAVNELSQRRIDGIIEILKQDLGFNLPFTDLEKDLQKVVSRSKSDSVKLKLAQKQFDELQGIGGDAATESDWSDELAVLGKFQGYAMRPKEITVAEYLAVKKQLKQHIDHTKTK